MNLRLLAALMLLFAAPLAPATERNPFLKPLPALPAPSAMGVLALPPQALPSATTADEKIWDTVDLVAISRNLILMRPQGGGTSLAVQPGRAFRYAGEWWTAMLEVESMVRIHRGREGKGGVVASLWLTSPAARVMGVGAGLPGAGGQPGAQPLGQAPAQMPVAAGVAR